MQSFARNCKVSLAGISPALLDDCGQQSLLDVAQYLPTGLGLSLFGFETHLGKSAATLDMALSVSSTTPGLSILAQQIPQQAIPATMAQTPEWQKIATFAHAWQQDTAKLKAALDVLCLEFDLPNAKPAQAVPLVFFGVEDQRRQRRQELGIDDVAVLESCMALFAGKKPDAALSDYLRHCDQIAQQHGFAQQAGGVFQVGLMLSRPEAGIRICVHHIPQSKVLAYLQAIGWPGDVVQLERVLAEMIAPFDRIALALDYAADGLTPKLGIECYFRDNVQPPKEARWQQVLQQFVDRGLCVPEKARGLLDFPVAKRLLPLADKELEAALGGQPGYFRPGKVMRGLHHLKVVLGGDGGLSAKGYLWCGFAH